jgi:diacylglycerol kinase (ATP)
MSRLRPSAASLVILGGLMAAYIVWSLLVTAGTFDAFDRRTVAPGLAPTSAAAEIWAAIAILTTPTVMYAGLVVVALWAFRRRLRNLAYALLLAIPLGWGSYRGFKLLFTRERPAAALDLITGDGWSYPSGHLVAVTGVTTLAVATVVVTRQPRLARGLAFGLGLLVLGVVAYCRWVLQAHWLSDLVGGLLLGCLVTALTLVLTRVHVLPEDTLALTRPRPVEPTGKKCVVIINPTKVTDVTTFRRHVEYELSHRGWEEPMWLETTRYDPGYEMAQVAIERAVDLVLVAGGDGTVRAVCEGLAGSDIPLGLLPAGTGNLLARNLGIPLDESEALRNAFEGEARPLDLVRLVVDPGTPEEAVHVFGVMAGIGVDAVIMERTNADLKRTVGTAAYFLAAAQNANHPPLPVTVTVDDGEPFTRRAAVALIGNVGLISGNIELIPGASASDGRLDVMIASPRTVVDWARVTTKVLTRRRTGDDRLDLVQGKRVRIVSERPDAYQVDGDTAGSGSVLEAEVLAGTLVVMLPPTPAW